jgi:O-antigen/teichoic acid export membrane protein
VASRLRQEPVTEYPDLLRRSWMWTGAMVPSSFGRATVMSLDLWMVQALAAGSESVGLYAAAFMVAQVPYLLVQGLMLSLFPKVSGALVAGSTELARRVTTQAIRLTLLLVPPACVLVGVSSSEILSLLMSSDYVSAGPVLRVLFTATALLATALLFLTIPPAADRPRVRTVSVLSILVLDAGLLAFFIPAWGLLGAAWATLIAFGSGALLSLVLVFHYTRALPPLGTVVRVGLAVALIGGIGSRWEAAGLEVIAKGAALGAIYLAALVATRELGAADLRDLTRALRPVARPTGAESRDARE